MRGNVGRQTCWSRHLALPLSRESNPRMYWFSLHLALTGVHGVSVLLLCISQSLFAACRYSIDKS